MALPAALLAVCVVASGCGAGSGTSASAGAGASSAVGSNTSGGAGGDNATGNTSGGGPGGSGTSGAQSASQGAPTSAHSAASTTIARSDPARLQIPDIGVDTAVMSLGLAADSTVEVPPIEANSPAGWYRGSPTPGQTGPSIILGHVTVGSYGDGVFRRLAELRPGARVLVRLQDGATVTFVVTSVRTVAKDQFPTEQVYGNVNRPELRLITCGGPHTGDGYRDNVVVFATLGAS